MKDLVVGDRRVRNNLVEIWNGFEWVVQPKQNALTGGIMNHPLTDEMCEELSGEPLSELAEHRAEWIRQDMRAAYDFAVEKITEQWENAVQSDLEHGVRCLNERYTKELISKYPRIYSFGEVLEAIRQQEDN